MGNGSGIFSKMINFIWNKRADRSGELCNRHALQPYTSRSGDNGIKDPFPPKSIFFTPGTVWILMEHPAVIAARYPVSTTICCPGASSYSLMCPSNSRKTVPFPDRRCMINPSPPKRPPAMRFWKKTDISTPAVDARNALFWATISCPGAISNARISPGKLDANAISPVPPCAV